jgi:hypothetical protein
MTNSQAFDNYRNSPADSKYMPGMTVGGRYGLNGPGVDPNSPDTLKRISDAQNVARLGNGREAILASLNRSGYKAPPDKQHDFGLVNSGKFNEGGQRKEAYSPSETQKINDAKALLSSPERQKYLADRKATVDARKAERAPAVQAKAMAKTEARRFRQGIMSNADRLAFMNPTAAAQRDVGKAQVAAASARDRANDATNRDRIASGERIAQGRDKTAQQVSRDRVAAAYAANGIEPPTEGTKQNGQALDDNVYANMGPQEALDHMRKAGIPADEINARMNRVFASRSQGGHNWYTNPEGPGARGPVPPPQPKPKNYPPDVGPNAPQPEPTTNPKPTNGRAFTPRRRPGGSTSF